MLNKEQNLEKSDSSEKTFEFLGNSPIKIEKLKDQKKIIFSALSE